MWKSNSYINERFYYEMNQKIVKLVWYVGYGLLIKNIIFISIIVFNKTFYF